jgi:hypothetical protein
MHSKTGRARKLRAIHRPRPHLWAPYTHTGP